MAIQDATNQTLCANRARHPYNQRPPAIAIINHDRWPPNHWPFRCRDCLDALQRSDDDYRVAYLHQQQHDDQHHDNPDQRDQHDPDVDFYVAPI